MILHKLHADFGKLKDATLTLEPGLNVLELPNEAGKTTWSDFLLAMFYGVDTAERRSKNVLPVKEKYRPWDGTPMRGSIELTANGRRLTLERSGTERSPMAELRCLETESGLTASEITAQSCGRTLLGVERSVYERSGFLHQQQLSVSQDPALERRLSALVTTGDDGCSWLALDEQLRALKNYYRYNRSGQIPQNEARLAECRRSLAQVRDVQAELAVLAAQQQQCEAELAEHLRQRSALQTQAVLAQRERLAQAEKNLLASEKSLQEAQAQCAHLPAPESLDSLVQRIGQTQTELQTLELSLAKRGDPVRVQQLEGEDAAQQLKVDRDRLSLLPRAGGSVWLLPLLAAVLLLCGLTAALLPLLSSLPWIPLLPIGAGLALLGLILLTVALQRRSKRKLRQQTLAQLSERYGTDDPAAIAAQIRLLDDALRREKAGLPDRAAQQHRLAALQEQRQQLLNEVDAFGVKTDDLSAAAGDVRAALRRWELLEQAKQQLDRDRSHYAALQGMVKTSPLPDADVSPEEANRIAQSVDPALLSMRIADCEGRLRELRSRSDAAGGRLQLLGDALALEAEAARLETRISAQQQAFDAAELARQTLADANAALQSRFAPMLCERAGTLFSVLTGGRYERVLLDGSLNVRVQAAGDPTTRELRQLSAGTVDQLYLALRLAISELLLPDAPLVLDDALLSFDDGRAAVALGLLRELSRTRQILLFTCQSRERRLLAAQS